jgi:hypothetical protein
LSVYSVVGQFEGSLRHLCLHVGFRQNHISVGGVNVGQAPSKADRALVPRLKDPRGPSLLRISPESGLFQFNLERAMKRDEVRPYLRQARSFIRMSRRHPVKSLIFRKKTPA